MFADQKKKKKKKIFKKKILKKRIKNEKQPTNQTNQTAFPFWLGVL